MMRLRNNKALLHWSFALLFFFFVGWMSLVLIRGGGSPGFSPPIIAAALTVFWAASLFLIASSLRQACVQVEVLPDASVAVNWRYPFRKTTRIVSPAELSPASVIEARDAEGGVYFRARLVLLDGVVIDLAEAPRRHVCAGISARFNDALRQAGGASR